MTKIIAALAIQNCPAGEFGANLHQALEMATEAAARQAEIIVFPEMNLTGYVTGEKSLQICRKLNSELVSPLLSSAKKNKITILAGLAEKDNNGMIYGTHLVITPDGSIKKYRKIHTAPFEKKYFHHGDAVPVFQSPACRFGIQLCYDAHFPELSLAMALKGVDIIFIPHASPRGTCREKYKSWLRHMTARAFDNGVYIAACNQTGDNENGLTFPGICLLIGPDGNVISRNIDGRQGIHLMTIDLELIEKVRSHKMRYFLPNRRDDLFGDR